VRKRHDAAQPQEDARCWNRKRGKRKFPTTQKRGCNNFRIWGDTKKLIEKKKKGGAIWARGSWVGEPGGLSIT